jgi:modulator of FtsH protease
VDEWHDFFLAVAGAAAVLAGLVFVGVSINLDTIMSDPGYGLPGRALEALVLLVAVLIVTILLLVPAQGTVLAGAEVLAERM